MYLWLSKSSVISSVLPVTSLTVLLQTCSASPGLFRLLHHSPVIVFVRGWTPQAQGSSNCSLCPLDQRHLWRDPPSVSPTSCFRCTRSLLPPVPKQDSFELRDVVLPCTSKCYFFLGCFSDYLKTYLHITFSVCHDETIFLLDTRGKNKASGQVTWIQVLFLSFFSCVKVP